MVGVITFMFFVILTTAAVEQVANGITTQILRLKPGTGGQRLRRSCGSCGASNVKIMKCSKMAKGMSALAGAINMTFARCANFSALLVRERRQRNEFETVPILRWRS